MSNIEVVIVNDVIELHTTGLPYTPPHGGGAVDSVNGNTGDVTLVANDVGAYSKSESDNLLGNKADNNSISTVGYSNNYNDLDSKPTNVSQFTNDAGYLTQHQDISGKVDKEAGKGLSTNDYSNADKTKVSKIITNGDGTKYLSDDGNYKTVSGGGGMSMTVIDYDPSLPANQTVTTIGIDQAFPVAGTCTISGNTVTVTTPVNNNVYVGLPLSTDAEFEFDFSNMPNRSGVYFLKSTDDFMTAITTTNVAYHVVTKESSNYISQVISAGDGTAVTYGKSTEYLPINPTLKFMTGEAMMILESGLSTMQEVRDMLAGMGMSEQDINAAIATYTSNNWLRYQADGRIESFQIPKEFDTIYFAAVGLTTGDTFTIGVTKNNETTYSVPSSLSDGTYLKALGNCTLLGKSMKTGDFLQLYNNSQDGILMKQ